MRVLNEKSMDILWNWGKIEKDELSAKYQTNLVRLLDEVKVRYLEDQSLDKDALGHLVDELQEVGEFFDTISANCFTMVTTMRRFLLEGERPPDNYVPRLSHAIGQHIILTQTSSEEVEGKIGTLVQVDENKAIVQFGEDLWATGIDRIVVVPSEQVSIEEQTIQNQNQIRMFLRMTGHELTTVLPFFSTSGHSGLFQVKFLNDGSVGDIYLEDGNVYHVVLGDLRDEEALAVMLNKDEAEAHLFHFDGEVEHTIDSQLDQFIVTAAVLADKYMAEDMPKIKVVEVEEEEEEKVEEEVETPVPTTLKIAPRKLTHPQIGKPVVLNNINPVAPVVPDSEGGQHLNINNKTNNVEDSDHRQTVTISLKTPNFKP